MKAYVATTGFAYAALFIAHVARLVAEGGSPLGSWAFVVTSAGALAMATWSLAVYRAHSARIQE